MDSKITPEESSSMENIIDGMIHVRNRNCYDINRKLSNEPTCRITNNNIINISYFLSHKLPKCRNLNITLNDVKNGRILSLGTFGYSFLIEREDKTKNIIKIIVCNDKTKLNIIDKEIEMHMILSRLPEKYSQYFIKLHGYFINQLNSKRFGAKTSYNYYDITNNQIICSFPTKNLRDNCEIYLNLEAGENDLYNHAKHKYNQKDIEEITSLFFDLLDYYKTSENFIKNKEVFLHTDLKPENMVLVKNNDGTKKIKIIDFGLAMFSTKFINNKIGTRYVYDYLFTIDDKIYEYLRHNSPLIEIFIIIVCYYEILFMAIDGKRLYNTYYDIDIIIDLAKKYVYNSDEVAEDKKIKFLRMLILIQKIIDFYRDKLKIYIKDDYMMSDYDGFIIRNKTHPEETKDLFLENCNINNFIITKEFGYTAEPPIFDKKYDINLEYEYFKIIMKYYLDSEFSLEEYKKSIRESTA
jgi:serine/threonine protein kinase